MPSNEDLIEWEISRGYGPERIEAAMPGYLAERLEEAEAKAEALAEAAEKHLGCDARCSDPNCKFRSDLADALARYRGEKP